MQTNEKNYIMEKEILDKLKAEECKNQPSENFISGMPLYEMKLNGVDNIYFSECGFGNCQDLREYDTVEFLIIKGDIRSYFMISKRFVTNIEYLKHLIKNIK